MFCCCCCYCFCRFWYSCCLQLLLFDAAAAFAAATAASCFFHFCCSFPSPEEFTSCLLCMQVFFGRALGRPTESEHSSAQTLPCTPAGDYAMHRRRMGVVLKALRTCTGVDNALSFRRWGNGCVGRGKDSKRSYCRKHQSSRPHKLRRPGAGAVSLAQLVPPSASYVPTMCKLG